MDADGGNEHSGFVLVVHAACWEIRRPLLLLDSINGVGRVSSCPHLEFTDVVVIVFRRHCSPPLPGWHRERELLRADSLPSALQARYCCFFAVTPFKNSRDFLSADQSDEEFSEGAEGMRGK